MTAYDLHLLALAGSLAAAAIGWQIVFGLAGALSLAAGAAMGLGAYGAALSVVHFGLPPLAALAAGGLLAMALLAAAGVVVARLESHYFALATLALAEVAVLTATNWESLTGGANGLLIPPPPAWLDAPAARAGLAWGAALLAAAIFYAYRHAQGRQRLALLRAQPLAAKAFGVDAGRTRILAMAAGGLAGGIGGGAHAFAVGVVSPDNLAFKTMAAILAVVIVGGRRSPLAAALLALAVTWAPEKLRFLEQTYLVAYGLCLLAAILFLPNGLAALVGRAFRWAVPVHDSIGPHPGRVRPPAAQPEIPLSAAALTRRFGGLAAVDGVDIAFRPGEIAGLMGPNGAGKSTLLNLLNGLDRADSGAAVLAADARIGRAFQTAALVDELSAIDNVRAAGGTENDAWRALYEVDLFWSRNTAAGALGQGQRRFLEFARARAIRPQVLLLDEPAAGLSPEERSGLQRLVRAAADDGVAVIVVEHDVPFLADIADRLICMSEGRIIADGPAASVIEDPAVIEAYLGEAPT